MNLKKILLVLFLILLLSPISKTYAENVTENDISLPTTGESIRKVITQIQGFVSKPLTSIINKIEGYRVSTSISYEKKKNNIKEEIDLSAQKIEENQFLKVAEYSKLSFFWLLTFIFQTKFIFYTIFIFIIFIILRYILLLFFL